MLVSLWYKQWLLIPDTNYQAKELHWGDDCFVWTEGSTGTATDWQQRQNSFFKQQPCRSTVSLIRQVKDWAVAAPKLAPPHSTDQQCACCNALLLPTQTEITMTSALLGVAFSAWCIKHHCIPKQNAFGHHWIFKCLAYGLHTSPEKHKLLHTHRVPVPYHTCWLAQTHRHTCCAYAVHLSILLPNSNFFNFYPWLPSRPPPATQLCIPQPPDTQTLFFPLVSWP